MDSDQLTIGVVIFLATMTQGITGFGLALVAMPLLVSAVGIALAAPLVAAIGLFSPALIAWHYRHAFERAEILYAALGSLAGIPFGVMAIDVLDEHLVKLLLGAVVMGYVVFAVWNPRFVLDGSPRWGVGLGVAGGLLTGAYNTGGPALVIYGTGRGWTPQSFKANLQVLLVLHSVGVVVSHSLSHHYTSEVLEALPLALLITVAGTGTGLMLDQFIDAALFRKLVLVALLALGLFLIVSTLNAVLT